MAPVRQRDLPYGSAHSLSHTRQWRRGVVQEVTPWGFSIWGPGTSNRRSCPWE